MKKESLSIVVSCKNGMNETDTYKICKFLSLKRIYDKLYISFNLHLLVLINTKNVSYMLQYVCCI